LRCRRSRLRALDRECGRPGKDKNCPLSLTPSLCAAGLSRTEFSPPAHSMLRCARDLPYSIALFHRVTADPRRQDLVMGLPFPAGSKRNAPGAYLPTWSCAAYCREMPDLPALSRNFCTLPVAVFGSSSTKLTHCGVLK